MSRWPFSIAAGLLCATVGAVINKFLSEGVLRNIIGVVSFAVIIFLSDVLYRRWSKN